MARGWTEAKDVLIAAHLPDVKFEAHTSSSSVDALPVSTLILELRQCLYNTKHTDEYRDFKVMIQYPCDERRQAKALKLGHKALLAAIFDRQQERKVKNIKRHIEDTLIADGVDAMPAWLYEQCEEIHYINLKGHGDLW
jgi:hypothetical protein